MVTVITTALCSITHLLLYRAKDPKLDLFCQFVTWCSASNCAAELPKLSSLFPSLCAVCASEGFGRNSKMLPRNWMKWGQKKTSKNIHTAWRLEVLWAGSVSRKKVLIAIASSLGVKWRQNKKKAEPAWDWGYMGAAGEMLQSECSKSVSYVKTAHTHKCAHWQQQITFHMNTEIFFFIIIILNLRIIWASLLLLCAPDASAGQRGNYQPASRTFFPNCFKFSQSMTPHRHDRQWLTGASPTFTEVNW